MMGRQAGRLWVWLDDDEWGPGQAGGAVLRGGGGVPRDDPSHLRRGCNPMRPCFPSSVSWSDPAHRRVSVPRATLCSRSPTPSYPLSPHPFSIPALLTPSALCTAGWSRAKGGGQVGCHGGTTTREVAQVVGGSGLAVGVDIGVSIVEQARRINPHVRFEVLRQSNMGRSGTDVFAGWP